MTERQLRYQLRKEGYVLRKRGDGFMVVDMDRNFIIDGGEGNGFSLSFDEDIEVSRSVVANAS